MSDAVLEDFEMLREKEIIFSDSDISNFRRWLSLNMAAVTWQGRYKDEFEDFWENFFIEGLSLPQLLSRIDFAIYEVEIGPLVSWFNWMKEKLIAYAFIYKGADLYTLAETANLHIGIVSSILRDFFLLHFPYLDDVLSEKFQVTNLAHENIHLKFHDLKEELDLGTIESGAKQEEIQPSMEVTLYKEWHTFLAKMKKNLLHPQFDIAKLKAKATLNTQLKFIRDVIILFIVSAALILGIKVANKAWEKHLAQKIEIYEPQFKWLDKKLTFKEKGKDKDKQIKLNISDLEKVDDSKNLLSGDFEDEVRYDVESDVVLTSWDSLPKDFDVTSYEQSAYEEQKITGYRDSRYGNTKVYRVLLRSEDTNRSKSTLNDLLSKYQVTQVDNVKPGMDVPGGIYYNIFVPRKFLKEFLAQAMDAGEGVLYESRTRTRRNPPGKNKVFIWVKSI